MKMNSSDTGFSLVEILVSITIILMLVVGMWWTIGSYRSRQVVKSAALETVAILNEAKTRSVSGYRDTPHGVHIEENKISSFFGVTYNTNDTNTLERFQSDQVVFDVSDIGSDDIVFTRLTGTTQDYGSIIIRNAQNISRVATITVSQSGAIEYTP